MSKCCAWACFVLFCFAVRSDTVLTGAGASARQRVSWRVLVLVLVAVLALAVCGFLAAHHKCAAAGVLTAETG